MIAGNPSPKTVARKFALALSLVAALFGVTPAHAESGTLQDLPLAKIRLQIGKYNPFIFGAVLDLRRFEDGQIDGIFLDLPEIPGVYDQYWNLNTIVFRGQVTPPIEYPKGNRLDVLAFGVDTRFDSYKGGWAYITFKTYANGCRRLDFQVTPDVNGRPRVWLTYGSRAYNVAAIDIMTTMPKNVTVERAAATLGGGEVREIPLAQLPLAACPGN